MNKIAKFPGQPIFSQLLSLINPTIVSKQARKHKTDHYYKKFKTKDHLVTMLYGVYHKCSSLREVITGMQVCNSKLNHLGLTYSPRRSTFSEANAKRSSEVFEGIYNDIYKQYSPDLSDSHIKKKIDSKLYIVDSTTIKLFKEVLKNAGRNPADGKRKGGIKVHTMIKAKEDVPCLIKMTAAAKHDAPFVKNLNLPKGSIIVFDKAYNDYKQYKLWDEQGIYWVTRIKKNAVYEVISDNEVNAYQKSKGIKSDQNIILGHTSHKQVTRVEARLIRYYDEEKDCEYLYITNSKKLAAFTIVQIYQKRWQIETLFKRIKQNFPLDNFLGDNENAIRIQIWSVLIADLLIKVIQSKLKRKWSFSNLSSMIRIHLMSYVGLFKFLNNPEGLVLPNSPIQNKGSTLF